MIRGIVRFLIGAALFFAALFVLVAGIPVFRLLDPNVYKSALQNTNAYTVTSQQAQTQAYTLSDQISLGDIELTLLVRKAVSDELKVRVPDFLSAANVKNIIDRNIDNAGSYVNSATDLLNFYFPRSDLRTQLISGAISISNHIDEQIQSLPTCNGPQPAKLGEDLTCISSDLKQSGGAKALLDELLPADSLKPGADLPPSLQFLQGEDQQPLEVYAQQLGISNDDSIRQTLTSFAQIRGLANTLKLLILICLILVIFLFILYVALKKGGFLSKVTTAFKMIFFISIALTAVTASSLVLTAVVFGPQNTAFANLGNYGTLAAAVIKDVLGQMLIPTLIVAVVVAFFAFMVWLVTHALSSAIKTVD